MSLLAWALGIYGITTLISMATMSVGLGIVALAFGLSAGSMDRRLGLSARLFAGLAAALTAACALSLIAADISPLVYGGKSAVVRFWPDITKCFYLFLPLPMMLALRKLSATERTRVLAAWLWAFGALTIVGVAQHYTGWPRPQPIPGDEPYFHVTLALGHHLSVASILIFPWFAALSFAARPEGASEIRIPRGVLWAMTVLGAVALFWTFSRTLWLALPLGAFLWVWLTVPPRWAAALGAATVLALAIAFQVPAVHDRASSSIGISTRMELWRANLEFVRQRPWTGAGWHHNLETSGYYLEATHPGQSDYFVGHAHNNAIEMLGGTGWLGFGAWLIFCGGIFWITWRGRTPLSRAFFCAWTVFELNGLTQVNFWESKVLHQMAWVLAWSLLMADTREAAEQTQEAKAHKTEVPGTEP